MFIKGTFRFAVWVFLSLVLAGCAGPKPILVGFAGELTGRHADLGVAGRDGAQLALDMINEKGGINGRPIELIIKDDKGDPNTARQVDAELVEQGVVAIIGHQTSAQTAAVWDQMNQAQVVLLSPGASSSQFDGYDDYLFRLASSTELQAKALATHIYHTHGIRQLAGIYDLGNRDYAETLWLSIQTEFEMLGGDASLAFGFIAGETDLQTLMSEIKASEPEAVVFVAPAIDTALMTQYGQQQGLKARLFSSGWAATEVFLEKGGQAIEGVELVMTYSDKNPYPPFQDFVRRFEARYGRQPTFSAAFSYETVLVLANALAETNGQAEGLPEALVTTKNLAGVQGTISMDGYGDVKRDVYIAVVKDRQFEVINTIPATD